MGDGNDMRVDQHMVDSLERIGGITSKSGQVVDGGRFATKLLIAAIGRLVFLNVFDARLTDLYGSEPFLRSICEEVLAEGMSSVFISVLTLTVL